MQDYGSAKMSEEEQAKEMSQAYWDLWNPDVQARIDEGIEQNRKADGVFTLDDVAPGAVVEVEQVSHDFIFGAHIFNFNQLGSDECNQRYQALYGDLFNSATIAFYWKVFEMEEGKPRFVGEARDTADFWNAVEEPKKQPHWRRPATDPVVDFCEKKGVRLHGHPLTWGNQGWHIPDWLNEKLPEEYRSHGRYQANGASFKDMDAYFNQFTPAELEEMLPGFTKELNYQMVKRITDITQRYKDRIHSWDVVNESATDYGLGVMVPGDQICKSRYGLMPGDYDYWSFKLAEEILPEAAKLNINDYNLGDNYVNQVKTLQARGCKVDVVGAQLHMFKPEQCTAIAEGLKYHDPEELFETMDRLSQLNLPIHMSELTITAPGGDLHGEAIQAVIARNFYRLWFSVKHMMGITWWNVVDDCGAPGEPSVSGLFQRNMEPKLAYHALNDLINKEWKTRTQVQASDEGTISFRGFRGRYRLTWTSPEGEAKTAEVELS
ncbi:endo-1,4-beta-xylanase [Kiritimatiellota bacterium B12222]|nr:endo-1,4-beta-xylanase [Kiritimatiellota bacterium B12222]